MRISTTLNHEKRLLSILTDTYYFARSGAHSHAWILERIQTRFYGDPAYSKLPSWAKMRLGAHHDTLARNVYKPDVHAADLERMLEAARNGRDVKPAAYLRWAHRLDGIETTTDAICDAREAGDETVWSRVESTFVWNHRPDRTYSPWKNSNA